MSQTSLEDITRVKFSDIEDQKRMTSKFHKSPEMVGGPVSARVTTQLMADTLPNIKYLVPKMKQKLVLP